MMNFPLNSEMRDSVNKLRDGYDGKFNEEPAMSNLIIDGAAGGETKRRHDITFPLLTLHRGKDRVHFSTGFFQKENIVYTGVLQIFRTKNR
jgi:hypothetical protein